MKKKILVVEDDANTAKVLSLRLKVAGYDTLVAADGVEGLALAKKHKPDLVVTDVWMPIGMGFALAYRLRESAPELPIIFVTGFRRPGVQQAVAQYGAARLIEKPYDMKELLTTIEQFLKHPALPQPARARTPAPAAPLREAAKSNARRVLIVEDDRKIALSLALRLRAAGYEALMAHDALVGVTMAVKHRPDLIILDISMPAGNGFAVAERIQALVPNATPVVFLTASKQRGLRKRAMDLGAVGYFEKPYEASELLDAIGNALGMSTENTAVLANGN